MVNMSGSGVISFPFQLPAVTLVVRSIEFFLFFGVSRGIYMETVLDFPSCLLLVGVLII